MSDRLTIKQEKFAKAYVKEGNGKIAVESAGYDVANDDTAYVIASENLRKPKIAAAIERERIKLSEDPRFSPESLANELYEIAQEAKLDSEKNVARQTLMDIAKLAGHLVDKTQDVSKLPDDKIEELLSKLKGD